MPINYNQKANAFITYLVGQSSPIWRTSIAAAYAGDEAGLKAVALAAKKIERLRIDETTVRGIAGGPLSHATTFFNEDAEGAARLLPSELNNIITLLKENDRLLQVGAGRGKATLLLSSDNLIEADNLNIIDATDADALAKALIKQLADSQQDIADLKLQNAQLITKHEQIVEEMRNLRNENNLYSNATWS